MSLYKKTWLLLNSKQKNYIIFIFVLMFIAMFFEALSVGILLPLISILLRGDIDTSFFSYFFAFGTATGKNLIYVGLLITLVIFLVKNLNEPFSRISISADILINVQQIFFLVSGSSKKLVMKKIRNIPQQENTTPVQKIINQSKGEIIFLCEAKSLAF